MKIALLSKTRELVHERELEAGEHASPLLDAGVLKYEGKHYVFTKYDPVKRHFTFIEAEVFELS